MLDTLVYSLNWWQWLIVAAGALMAITPYGRAAMIRVLGFRNLDEGFETLILRAIMWSAMVVLVFVAIDIGLEVFGSVLMALICVVVVLSNVALLAWTFRYRDDGKPRMAAVFFACWLLVFGLTVAGSQTRLNAKLALVDAEVGRATQLIEIDAIDIDDARSGVAARVAAGQAAIQAAEARVRAIQSELDTRVAVSRVDLSTPAGLREAQDRLGALGYDTGGRDGIVGEKTRAAGRDNANRIRELQRDLSQAQADVASAAQAVAAADAGASTRIDAARESLRSQIAQTDATISSDDAFGALAAILSFLWPFGVVTAGAAKALYTGLIAFAVDLVAAISTTALYHGVGSTVTKARRAAWDDLTDRLDATAADLRGELATLSTELEVARAEMRATADPEAAAAVVERVQALEAAQEQTRSEIERVVAERAEIAEITAALEAKRRLAERRSNGVAGGTAEIDEARRAMRAAATIAGQKTPASHE